MCMGLVVVGKSTMVLDNLSNKQSFPRVTGATDGKKNNVICLLLHYIT